MRNPQNDTQERTFSCYFSSAVPIERSDCPRYQQLRPLSACVVSTFRLTCSGILKCSPEDRRCLPSWGTHFCHVSIADAAAHQTETLCSSGRVLRLFLLACGNQGDDGSPPTFLSGNFHVSEKAEFRIQFVVLEANSCCPRQTWEEKKKRIFLKHWAFSSVISVWWFEIGVPQSLGHLDTWSQLVSVWERLGGVPLLEKVCYWA